MDYEKLAEIKRLIVDYGKQKQNITWCEENYVSGLEAGIQDKRIADMNETTNGLLKEIMYKIESFILYPENK